MNITYSLQGRKEVKKLLVRMRYSKLDISCSTNIMLKDAEWDLESQSVINNPELNISLQQLKTDLLKDYNKDFSTGKIVDKIWVASAIKNSFNRPKEETKLINPAHTIYFVDFALWWLENHANDWNVSSKKKMGLPLQNQYKKFVSIVSEYESVISERLQLRNIRISDLKSFADYLETEFYQVSTIERHVGRFRFFLNRALEHNIEVSNSFKQRIYFDKDDDLDKVYLDEKEILTILKKDFSFDPELDIAKQNLLILLHSGLRIGDFMKNLDISNISNGVIKIKTQKTGQPVVIPVHKIVLDIINRNHGNLPPKMHSWEFNKAIKTICMVCEIDEVVEGKVFDSKKKRKIRSFYKKYELITAHSTRRGFVSIYKDKISKEAMCSILGWSSDQMIAVYNQRSKNDYAKELQLYWNEK